MICQKCPCKWGCNQRKLRQIIHFQYFEDNIAHIYMKIPSANKLHDLVFFPPSSIEREAGSFWGLELLSPGWDGWYHPHSTALNSHLHIFIPAGSFQLKWSRMEDLKEPMSVPTLPSIMLPTLTRKNMQMVQIYFC